MTALRISRTHYPVTALGPGTRLGIWVQGCSLSCKGCMSQDTWNPSGGREVAVDELVELWRRSVADGADGLTISGGEPLQQAAAIGEFLVAADEVRSQTSRDVDILVYTGYEKSEMDDPMLRAVAAADVLVTGRFDITRPTSLIWRGSANQTMLARTALGRRRYAEYVDFAPEQAPIQARVDAEGLWLIGVPRRGGLAGLERDLRSRGLAPGDVSWRR